MIDIETIYIVAALLNTTVIGILVAKKKWNWAFGLALIQALLIGGLMLWH